MNAYFNWSLPSLLSLSELSIPITYWVQRHAGSWFYFTIRLALPSFDPVVTGAVIQVSLRWVLSTAAALK